MTSAKFIRVNILSILIILFIISGCPCPDFIQYGSILGSVTDLHNNPIPDVKITLEDRVVYSDDRGLFVIDEVLEGVEQILYFSKSGYADNQKLVDVVVDENSYVLASLGKWNTITTIDPSIVNDINFQNASVSLPANGIVDQNGSPFTGNVNVKASYLDPMSNNYGQVFPGDFEGESANGATVPIESFGFINVTLSEGDQMLNLATGAEATISIPINDQLKAVAPSQIPLWYFDEELGRWIEEGTASNENGVYVGKVTHFTAWNVDMEMDVANVKGRVVDHNGNILPKAKVYSTGVNYSGSTNSGCNSNGEYKVTVKSNALAKIQAKLISDGGLEIVSSQSVTVQSEGSGTTKTIVDLVIDLRANSASSTLYGVNCDLETHWAVGDNGGIFYYDTLWFKVPTGLNEDLFDIDCPVYDSYWVVGSNGTLLNSTDQGQTWNQIPLGISSHLKNVDFLNGFYGWIVGEGGLIYRTQDGGNTWNQVLSNTNDNLTDIYFTDKENGWICGDKGTILHSVDSGQSWVKQINGTSGPLEGIEFLDNNKGWAVGNQGLILRTLDGGQNWNVQSSGTTENLTDISLAPIFGGVISGKNGTVLKSIDKGENCTKENLPISNDLEAIDLDGYGNGIVVGNDYSEEVKLGQNLQYTVGWVLQNSGISEGLADVEAVSATTAWAVGLKGSIIRTTDGGSTWLPISTINTLGYDLYSVEVFGNHIWVGGEYKMWKSSDNGQSWVEISSDYSLIVEDIQFVDASNGWYLGRKKNDYNDRQLYKTADGGLNWTQVKNFPSGSNSYFPGFKLIDANTIGVLDYDPTNQSYLVYHSFDGGTSWNSSNLQYSFRYADGAWQAAIDHADGSTAIVSQGWIHQSENLFNWYATQTTRTYIYKLEMINSQVGWVVDTGIVYKTVDGGQSWITQGGISFYIFGALDIDMIDSLTGWIVKNSGEIYYTTTGGD